MVGGGCHHGEKVEEVVETIFLLFFLPPSALSRRLKQISLITFILNLFLLLLQLQLLLSVQQKVKLRRDSVNIEDYIFI